MTIKKNFENFFPGGGFTLKKKKPKRGIDRNELP
jgi:hypothetical protein